VHVINCSLGYRGIVAFLNSGKKNYDLLKAIFFFLRFLSYSDFFRHRRENDEVRM
jgi:hypothetical protein